MLPPEFREEIFRLVPDGRIMLTNNFDGAISGYPMPEWEQVEASFRSGNTLLPGFRDIERFFIAGATEVTLDKQGRILIPPYLRTYAALDKELVLAGVGTKFEIWDQVRFEERLRLTAANFNAHMEAMAASGVALRF